MKRLTIITVFLVLVFLSSQRTFAQNGHDLFQKGLMAERSQGDLDEAIRLEPDNAGARPILEPRYADAILGRGLCWHHLGEQRNALADYNEAIRLEPKMGEAFLYRGSLRTQHGEMEEGIEDFDEQ